MKRNKKGISLITLVITIIIMIILAAAIVLTLTQSGIFDKANEATGKYNLQQVQKIAELAWAEAYADGERDVTKLQEAVNSALQANKLTDKYKAIADEKGVIVKEKGPGGTDPVGDATVNQKADENSTIDGKPYSATNPIIPKGFMPINTATSKWDEGAIEDNLKNGLVISDENGNEFVWIPVKDINAFARLQDGSDTNYRGVLYEFHYEGTEERPYNGHYREPANLTYYQPAGWIGDYEDYLEVDVDSKDYAARFTTIIWTENYYQESFNKMVKSVAKYKGFYAGRYEMSLDKEGKAQSKMGQESATGTDESPMTWWELYEKATTYSNLGIVSEMFWGCQWDAMMIWMLENDINIYDNCLPFDTARGENSGYNQTKITGFSSEDILNNIYDINGNRWEWTQEALGTGWRTHRGHAFYDLYGPGYRDSFLPQGFETLRYSGKVTTYGLEGTRLTLYIPVTE